MKKLLLVLTVVVLALGAATFVQQSASPTSSPYVSALSDAAIGTAVAQSCPCQTCIPEMSSYPSGCVSNTETTYCQVLVNQQTGQRFCGWGEYCEF